MQLRAIRLGLVLSLAFSAFVFASCSWMAPPAGNNCTLHAGEPLQPDDVKDPIDSLDVFDLGNESHGWWKALPRSSNVSLVDGRIRRVSLESMLHHQRPASLVFSKVTLDEDALSGLDSLDLFASQSVGSLSFNKTKLKKRHLLDIAKIKAPFSISIDLHTQDKGWLQMAVPILASKENLDYIAFDYHENHPLSEKDIAWLKATLETEDRGVLLDAVPAEYWQG